MRSPVAIKLIYILHHQRDSPRFDYLPSSTIYLRSHIKLFYSGWIEFEKTTFNTNEVWESGSRYTRTRTCTHTRAVCSERRKAREVANGSLGCARAFFFSLRSLLIFIPARVLRAISTETAVKSLAPLGTTVGPSRQYTPSIWHL